MKQSLYKSLALHFVVFLLIMVDIPLFWHNKTTLNQVPIIVDLNNVKISEMTNLPPKAKMGKEDKAASKVKRKIENNYTKEEPKKDDKRPTAKEPEEETAPEEAAPTEPKKDYLVAPQPKKPKAPKKKPTPPVPAAKPKPKPKPKPEVKKEQKQPEKGKPQLANPLKSLLASVDALEKEVGNTNQEATIKEGTEVNNMGIEGGTGGSYFSELSISEIDAIAGRLRACWNLDPGAMGIKDMIIEIRAFLNKDGSVRKVDIINTSRYNSDAHFRSVADSARRAVYICAPYSIFADKYADKYHKWNTTLLRFDPLDGQIR